MKQSVEFIKTQTVCCFEVRPSLSGEQARQLPSVQFTGNEGSEWLPPTHYLGRSKSTVEFEGRAFSLSRPSEIDAYAGRIADLAGADITEVIIPQPESV